MKRRLLPVLSLVILFQAPILAGVVFQIETKDLTESPPGVDRALATIDGDRLRIDTEYGGGEDPKTSLIYRGDQQVLLALNHTRRQVMEFDRENMKEIGSQMSQAMKEMEKQMANLPPEQREMMKKMMKGKMSMTPPAGPKSQIEVRKTSEQGTSHGYAWTKYEVFEDGQKVREYLVTDWSNVGIERNSFEVFSSLGEFFRELVDSLGTEIPVENPFEEMDKLDGFPVVTRDFQNDALMAESVLKAIDHKNIDPDRFEAPPEYRQAEMGGMAP